MTRPALSATIRIEPSALLSLWVLAALFALVPLVALVPKKIHAATPAEEGYRLHCSGCHRQDGRGDPRIVPSLLELDRLIKAPGGREYVVRVPGVAQAPIPSQELAELLNWVLTELDESSDFIPFTESEVESLRHTPLRDPKKARPEIP